MRFSSLAFKRSPRFLSGQTWAIKRARGVILRHPGRCLMHRIKYRGGFAMRKLLHRAFRPNLFFIASLLAIGASCAAQQPEGPQSDAPTPVAPKPVTAQTAGSSERITVPSGTRVGVVLQNGISTRSAKPGDSVYLQTSFPITVSNRIVIPFGSYLRGELIDSKRPARIKGRGEFRMRLNTLIFPTGYTVDLNAAPRRAASGGRETMDEEGKIPGPGDKAKDAGPIAATTAEGAGIGAIAARTPKGAGIGAGIGAAVG